MKLVRSILAFSLSVTVATVVLAQGTSEELPGPSPSPSPSPTPGSKNEWRVQLFNGDDRQYVVCNGQKLAPEAGFNQSVEVNLNECLIPGRRNDFEIVLYNTGGGYAWGYRILKNGAVAVTAAGKRAERMCGKAGTVGCDNNASAPVGVFRTWKYHFKN